MAPKPPDQTFEMVIRFDFGKPDLSRQKLSQMDPLIDKLKGLRVSKLISVGHTDPIRVIEEAQDDFMDNQVLSILRANLIATYLREGIGFSRDKVAISGHNFERPIQPGLGEAERATNRRVEVKIIASAQADPARLSYRIDVEGGDAPVSDVRVHSALPKGAQFLSGTVRVDGVVSGDPVIGKDRMVFALGDLEANARRVITFDAVGESLVSNRHVMRAHFENGIAVLRPSEQVQLENIANELSGESFDYLEVIGHTDSNLILAPEKIGFSDNQALSEGRAKLAADYLMDRLLLPAQYVRMTGKAATEPIGDNTTDEGRALNRRVVVIAHEKPEGTACPEEGRFEISSYALFSAGKEIDLKTPISEATVPCKSSLSFLEAPSQRSESFLIDTPTSSLAFSHEGSKVVEGNKPVLYAMAGAFDVEPVSSGTLVGSDVALSPNGSAIFPRSVGQVEFLADRSYLIADGITVPTIAVRLADELGNPVKFGEAGSFVVLPPYRGLEQLEMDQKRVLAGMDRFDPKWKADGNDGIVFIKLAPTTQTGEAVIQIRGAALDGVGAGSFTTNGSDILRVVLQPDLRDFILVGFAEGTVGYNTIKDNHEAAFADKIEDNVYTDGQVSLYAKGKISGEWLMTLAFDSDKPEHLRRKQSLFGVVDPGQFYTLYGDATGQGKDAQSQRNLYIKVEKKAFYAMFGDFETGLDQTRLARYSRSLNGVKANYSGDKLLFTVFGAETPQHFVRDEIQGDGTSGLYKLSRGGLVLNSERIQILTKDRYHADKTVQTRELTRHLDYDIDYGAGTIYFREPIQARDFNLNPIFIIANYETLGVSDQELNAGGHVGVKLFDGKLKLGASQIRDENDDTRTDLTGLNAALKIGGTALRIEGALSEQTGNNAIDADGFLVELEHQADRWGLLAYTNRLDAGFGVKQQSVADIGRERYGLSGRLKITDVLGLSAEVSRDESVATTQKREVLSSKLEYKRESLSLFGGVQVARDKVSATTSAFESHEVNVGATKRLLSDALEVSIRADVSLDNSKNSSIDYPSRYLVQAGYSLTKDAKLIVAHEMSDGESFDTQMTRFGLQANPWAGARLSSTLNQSISEQGARQYASYGLSQSFLINDRWGVDFSLDQSRTFNESETQSPVNNVVHPIASGGSLGSGVLHDDYLAVSAGATYRHLLWSWNIRVENRNAGIEDRVGVTTGFLREAKEGVAFASSIRYFETNREVGAQGQLGNVNLSVAYRPLGFNWSVLDRLELRHETSKYGTGVPNAGLFGAGSLSQSGEARSQAVINHLNINRVSKAWSQTDIEGNILSLNERNQWSIYYGSKYSFDQYNGTEYKGYTDLIGFDVRHDIKTWLDIGLHASRLNSYNDDNYKYAVGPSIGITPVRNGWLSLGYNVSGFYDRDFTRARYTAQGFYFTIRVKFDQETRLR
ncbi:MAG: OmpA family protein [Nitrospirota bacterium]